MTWVALLCRQSGMAGTCNSSHPWDDLDRYRGSLLKGKWPTLPELFRISQDMYGGKTAFSVFHGHEKVCISFSEALETIRREAAYLRRMGVRKGDKVMLMGRNSPDWALAYFAIPESDAIAVPMDAQMRADKCVRLAKFADVRFIIADTGLLSELEAEDGEWFSSLLGAASLENAGRWMRLSEAADEPGALPTVSEDDTAAILFTSGTTGNEKGVVLTHANITSDVYMTVNEVKMLSSKDVTYALLPLHHSYCCTAVLLEAVRIGAECLFGHGFAVSRMLDDMKRGGVTVFMGIPMLYNKLLSGIMTKVRQQGMLKYAVVRFLMEINSIVHKATGASPLAPFFRSAITSKAGLDKVRLLISGAGPLSSKVVWAYHGLGLEFIQGYGLTEASPIVTLNPPEHFKTASIGHPLAFIDLIIADKDEDGVGEIRIKGPNVCKGYYNDPENTAALFDRNGYMRTGDLGYMDKDGYVFLKGRAKNIIVTEGGKNVFPEEIEDMFQLYSEISQIMVRGYQKNPGVPGEAVEAVVYPDPDHFKGASDEEVKNRIDSIVSQVNKGLESFQKIERVTIVPSPMEETTTRKIKRGQVKV